MMGGWLIIGASGHGRSLASIIRGRGDRIAALSDNVFGQTTAAEMEALNEFRPFRNADGTLPVCFANDRQALDFAVENLLSIAVGIGHNGVRGRIAEMICQEPRYAHLIAPLVASSATVDPTAALGNLSQVCEHAHIGPLAHVGNAVIVNTGAIVEHEAEAGAGSHLAPGSVLLGAAKVGEYVFLGSGARVLPGISVGSHSVLGAGAVATRQLEGMATYVGVPARRLISTKGQAN